MGDRTCAVLVVNTAGLCLLLLADDPTLVGLGVVLIAVAVGLFIKDEVKYRLDRRRHG